LDNISLPFKISTGKFSGRVETIYYPKNSISNEVFLFVLQDAFEAAGRLLHTRDGLALSDTNEIEMESIEQ